MGKEGYNTKGLYNAYDKNHKERDALDYYSTPTDEVLNILHTIGLKVNYQQIILEPCVGGGHMAEGIQKYLEETKQVVALVGSDIQDRGYRNDNWALHYGQDFFSDDYLVRHAEWIIMNPPYSVIEPFVIRALDIAKNGVLMLARLQFLEGASRYEKILKENPPTDVYVYVDRIQCWKNGVKPDGSSAQAYAWFFWNKTEPTKETKVHWIRRAN